MFELININLLYESGLIQVQYTCIERQRATG